MIVAAAGCGVHGRCGLFSLTESAKKHHLKEMKGKMPRHRHNAYAAGEEGGRRPAFSAETGVCSYESLLREVPSSALSLLKCCESYYRVRKRGTLHAFLNNVTCHPAHHAHPTPLHCVV